MSSGLEKKTKSFPDDFTLEGEPGKSREPGEFESLSATAAPCVFEFNPGFWESLYADPVFRRNLDNVIDRKVEERIAGESKALIAEMEKRAHQEGFQKGLADSQEERAQTREAMNRVCSELLADRETILHQHEKLWCEAFGHLLQRFLVPRPEQLVKEIKQWMQDSLSYLSGQGKVFIHLSPRRFDALARQLSPSPGDRWEFVKDAKLMENDIACESADGGGMFFSESQEFKKLINIMQMVSEAEQC